jgi:Asp-tRNA(Asn)/Glu-tRNA(Gln) amidotransferase A subunit family amidase
VLAVADPPELALAEPATLAALDLAAGLVGARRALPEPFTQAAAAQATIMQAEYAVALAQEPREQFGPVITAFTDPAAVPTAGQLAQAREQAARCRAALEAAFAGVDALILPAALGEAPDRSSTGDPIFCRTWSLLGSPAVSVPGLRGPAGLPVGLQVVGRPGSDRTTLAAARWLSERLAGAQA